MTAVLLYVAGILSIVLVLHFVRKRRSESVLSIVPTQLDRKPAIAPSSSDQNERAWPAPCGEVDTRNCEVVAH